MMSGWLALFTLLAYLCALAAVARFGERAGAYLDRPFVRRALYVLGCCVFVGFPTAFSIIEIEANQKLAGLLFLLAPLVVSSALFPLITRMAVFARRNKITSVADFIAAPHGKSPVVTVGIALLLTFGYLPFSSLQITDIASSLLMIAGDGGDPIFLALSHHMTFVVTCALALLTVAVAPRRVDVTEHQKGLVLVVAAESIIKFSAFLAVGIYVTWFTYAGVGDLVHAAVTSPRAHAMLSGLPDTTAISIVIAYTLCLIMTAPQFHMAIVENKHISDIRAAAWFVPLYTIATMVFLVPVVAGGALFLPGQNPTINLAILDLPLHGNATVMTLLALIGGVAATTSVLLVGTIVITIMVSNNLIVPALLHLWFQRRESGRAPFAPYIVRIRQATIFAFFMLTYLLALLFEQDTLTAIAKIVVVLLVQLACPFSFVAFTGGRPKAVVGGFVASGLMWLYTLALPLLATVSAPLATLVANGPFRVGFLRPTALFGLDIAPFAHGLFWTLFANIFVIVAGELFVRGKLKFRAFTGRFVRRKTMSRSGFYPSSRRKMKVGDLKATIAHYLGAERTNREFEAYFASRDPAIGESQDANNDELRFGESLLATAIGTLSSRLVISLLERYSISTDDVIRLIHGVSSEIRDENALLYKALAGAQQGVAFFDRDLKLVAYNKGEIDVFPFCDDLLRVGARLQDLVRAFAERGFYGPGQVDDLVAMRFRAILDTTTVKRIHGKNGQIVDLRSARLPDGALCMIYMDVTNQAMAEENLGVENETLERRVRERTEELELLNAALVKAKAEAEEANISKTRFLAAASHDLLQPLNAARLYATSLKERVRARASVDDSLMLALNVEESLEAVEDILTALLDISRLDAGGTKPEITTFRANDIFKQLQLEFEPIASAKGLTVTFMPSSLPIVSDRRLLRRLLQNIISNAVKYTSDGRVIVGMRRGGDKARIEVWDTGLGIPKSKQRDIFREFERLPNAVKAAPGVGLGLSIVERLNRVLGHEIKIRSKPGRGSVFSVIVPSAPMVGNTLVTLSPRGIINGKQRSLEGLVVAAIDNEAAILAGMEAMLGGWDCEVVVGMDLASVEEALKIRNLSPDVIIADYHLGESNGITVIDMLRSIHGPSNAILVTADRSPGVRELAHDADIRFLNKPLKPAALRSLLSQWRLVKQAAE